MNRELENGKKTEKLSELPENDPKRTELVNATVDRAIEQYGSALKELARK